MKQTASPSSVYPWSSDRPGTSPKRLRFPRVFPGQSIMNVSAKVVILAILGTMLFLVQDCLIEWLIDQRSGTG